jgi:glycosyltransferase involved in cell wall biosynthesis
MSRNTGGGQVTLLKNYAPARQHSINNYAEFLEGILARSGLLAGSWRPHGLYSYRKGARRPGFLSASIDKYALAPIEAAFRSADILHIVDNSNAWYSFSSHYKFLIVTVHDMIPWKCANGMIEGWEPSAAARTVLRLNLAAMHRADVLVAVSDTTRRDLLAAGFDATKIRVIHNCNLNPALAGNGDRWNGRDLRTTFVHFGAGKYPKHSELVLEAFEQTVRAVPDARLILVGPRAPELAATFGASPAVEAYDHVTAAEVRYLYDHVAAVLMPSRYEGFGLPVLEAQESNCLIVTSDGGALDEVMQAGPLKLARPIAAEALADTMVRILGDDAFCDLMREHGRANAARFARARAETGYERFYRGIGDDLAAASRLQGVR